MQWSSQIKHHSKDSDTLSIYLETKKTAKNAVFSFKSIENKHPI